MSTNELIPPNYNDIQENIQSIKDAYADMLILQYRNKPKARATVQMLADLYSVDGLWWQFPYILDIDTAQGPQLDLIGKILGVGRNVQGIQTDYPYFSFEFIEEKSGYIPATTTTPYLVGGNLYNISQLQHACLAIKISGNTYYINDADFSHIQPNLQNKSWGVENVVSILNQQLSDYCEITNQQGKIQFSTIEQTLDGETIELIPYTNPPAYTSTPIETSVTPFKITTVNISGNLSAIQALGTAYLTLTYYDSNASNNTINISLEIDTTSITTIQDLADLLDAALTSDAGEFAPYLEITANQATNQIVFTSLYYGKSIFIGYKSQTDASTDLSRSGFLNLPSATITPGTGNITRASIIASPSTNLSNKLLPDQPCSLTITLTGISYPKENTYNNKAIVLTSSSGQYTTFGQWWNNAYNDYLSKGNEDLLILEYDASANTYSFVSKLQGDIQLNFTPTETGVDLSGVDWLNLQTASKSNGIIEGSTGGELFYPTDLYDAIYLDGENQTISPAQITEIESEGAYGFSTLNQLSEGYFKSASNSDLSYYTLSDTEYRTLLKFKSIINVERASIAEMEQGLYNAFGLQVILVNNQDLSITYIVNKKLSIAVQAALKLGYLTAPIGVGLKYVISIGATSAVFGFRTKLPYNNSRGFSTKKGANPGTFLSKANIIFNLDEMGNIV